MTQFKRKNAWDANNGGQFKNADGSYTDLYWYAKGVQVMQSLPTPLARICNPCSAVQLYPVSADL